jgi:hypothetical protein
MKTKLKNLLHQISKIESLFYLLHIIIWGLNMNFLNNILNQSAVIKDPKTLPKTILAMKTLFQLTSLIYISEQKTMYVQPYLNHSLMTSIKKSKKRKGIEIEIFPSILVLKSKFQKFT